MTPQSSAAPSLASEGLDVGRWTKPYYLTAAEKSKVTNPTILRGTKEKRMMTPLLLLLCPMSGWRWEGDHNCNSEKLGH